MHSFINTLRAPGVSEDNGTVDLHWENMVI